MIIWTDVDGVLTADPRLVPEAQTIPEISYREAAELAYFGAKVLHPKTLRAVRPSRNSRLDQQQFCAGEARHENHAARAQQRRRRKSAHGDRDVSLIAVGGPGIVGVPDVVAPHIYDHREVRANVLLISQSSSQNDICFIVASADAKRTAEALREEFAQDVAHEKVEHITVDPNIAIVAAVGENMRGDAGMAGRTFGCLGRET